MPEADMSMTQMAMDPSQTEDRCYAKFYPHAKQNMAKTNAEGRPIFDERVYVMIMVPGDKDNIVKRPARENDKQRFHKQWAAFERGQEQVQEGTPLEQWPLVSRGQVEELKFFGIHTVEALSAMPDSQTQKFMGINALKQRATDYVESAKSNAPILELRQQNDAQAERIADLERQMAEIIAAQAKPGRKKAASTE